MSNPNDLIKRFNNLDEAAFAEVFKLCHRFLTYYVQKFSLSKEEAEEIVSEAFVNLFKSVQKGKFFEDFNYIKNFLYAVARNAAINQIDYNRRHSLYRKSFLIETENLINGPDFNQVETELLQAIYDAIEGLPKVCRQIFKLLYLKQLSYEEIAKELGLSVQTVRNQKSRAIILLKKRIGNPPGLPDLAKGGILALLCIFMYMVQIQEEFSITNSFVAPIR